MKVKVFLFSSLISISGFSENHPDPWFQKMGLLSSQRLLDNILLEGPFPGAVIAGTTRVAPNYYSHWVRDAAIVAIEVANTYEQSSLEKQSTLLPYLVAYVNFSKHVQALDNRAGEAYGRGLGEVRFNPDGTAFNEDWGRPQHDGPALRAISMMRIHQILLKSESDEASRTSLLKSLYSADIADRSVIKSDLEYLAHFAQTPCVDLWEELTGSHFYTLMTVRASLEMGASFAQKQNDPSAGSFYLQQSTAIGELLENHWIPSKGLIAPTLNYQGGLSGKTADLDISVLLAALHVGDVSNTFSILDPRIAASSLALLKRMDQIYPINRVKKDKYGLSLAPAVGRYPEDVYDGVGFSGGNPWFLATLAYAEWLSRISHLAQKRNLDLSEPLAELMQYFGYDAESGKRIGRPERKALIEIADRFFRRVRQHTDGSEPNEPTFSGRLSEQFDRDTGFQRGAENLTWSYAACGSALRAYRKAE